MSENLNEILETKPNPNDISFQQTSEYKPIYLSFLRTFAGINLALGIIASFAFFVNVMSAMDSRSDKPSYAWIISLSLMIEGFLAFGLLNAIADIAENMREVGFYVRELRKKQNP